MAGTILTERREIQAAMLGEEDKSTRDESQNQEAGVQGTTPDDDMKQWEKTIRDDHGPTFPQARKVSVGLGRQRGRRVSQGYQEIGQQLQMQMALKEMSRRPEIGHDIDEEDTTSPSVHHASTVIKSEELGSKPKDAKQLEKDRLKENVLHGRTSQLNSIMYDFVESKTFTGFILFIILINTGILMAQTYAVVTVRVNWYFSFIDSMFLSVYLIECALKVYVYRRLYFKEGWNLLDFTIVVFNIFDFLVPMVVQNIEGFNIMTVFRILRMFRAFRAIRALRVLRTIRFMSNLQVIMTTCLQSIQSMGAIVMLILLVLYMFAVIGRGLYFKQDPVRFGMLPSAAFTLFQLLTLDDWFEIYTDITKNDPNSWHIFIFLFVYIVMEYFVFLNLFVAVLVDNFQLTLEASNEEKRKFLRAQEQEEEDDDEDDLYHTNNQDDAASDITRSSEQSARLPRKSVSELYISQDSSEQDHLRHYFQCLAALEYVSQQLDSQKKTIDNIVDLCIETSDDVVT